MGFVGMPDWKALRAKFENEKTREIKGKRITYITARQVMDRLDIVLSPENWRDTYRHYGKSVVCTLFIRCGDEWVGKTDTGTESNWEPEKGGYSDALKRAAVRWGIGRYLYGDGENNAEHPPTANLHSPESDDGRPTQRSSRKAEPGELCPACHGPNGKHATNCVRWGK